MSKATQAAALSALAEAATLTEAAERAGVSRRTLYSWIHEDTAFIAAYEQMISSSEAAALDTLTEKTGKAVEVVAAILEDEEQPGAVRLKAAQTILDLTARQRERVTVIQQHRGRALTEPVIDWSGMLSGFTK